MCISLTTNPAHFVPVSIKGPLKADCDFEESVIQKCLLQGSQTSRMLKLHAVALGVQVPGSCNIGALSYGVVVAKP